MNPRILLTVAAFLLCDAKLPGLNPTTLNGADATQRSEHYERSAIRRNAARQRREAFDPKTYESSLTWAHSERLDDNGDVVLRWVTSDSRVTFRLEARTRGYIGLGFSAAQSMRGADLVVAWVDDRNGNAQILDCHGSEYEDRAVADEVQNYELISGYQNDTHTTVEFRRQLDTCDRQDFVIGEDTTQILWALGPNGSDGQLPSHVQKGSRPLRLLQPLSKPDDASLMQWDIRLNDLNIPNVMATLFWCKIFKAPELQRKHHMVGYEPIIESRPIKNGRPVAEAKGQSPVHHMVLYECAEDRDAYAWNEWAKGDGFYGPNRPSEWAICANPVAAWAMGSKGEFLPENVGIPIGKRGGASFYMLEVHYDNQELHEVLDSSGIRIHYTPQLRAHDAALLGAGIGVSALHVIPPKQRHYRTVGICGAECTNTMIPDEGITIVSVLLHAHSTAKKISLKHVRGNDELPRVSEENSYDVRYQQSRIVPGGRKFLKGDTLITECTYDSTQRDKPILGGYSAMQEMCLSFVLYYPRTQLAGCYSMTPAKEFFETFGVKEFYGVNMMQVENTFLSSSYVEYPILPIDNQGKESEEVGRQGDDQGVGFMKELVIKEPTEFRNKTFMAHLNEMPWSETLLTEQIEKTLYRGMHMTFCKKNDDSWGAPVQIQNYPNFTELTNNDTSEKSCHYKSVRLPSVTKTNAATQLSVRWSAILAASLLAIAR